jgi:hypothetical protein
MSQRRKYKVTLTVEAEHFAGPEPTAQEAGKAIADSLGSLGRISVATSDGRGGFAGSVLHLTDITGKVGRVKKTQES